MSKALPFKTQPRQATATVGSPDIGELEFPRYGSLLWFEREALRKADEGFSLFRESALVAGQIAHGEGLAHVDAHEMVTRILAVSLGVPGNLLTPQEMEIRAKYSEILSELNDRTMEWNDRRQVAGVTAVIANRLPGCDDWSEADTRSKITETMMGAIYQFVSEEESGTAPKLSEAEQRQQLTEELGKSPTEPGDPNPNPTGSTSIGDSEPSTPEPQSSVQSALALTPSTSSSAPLRRGSGKKESDSTAKNSGSLSSPV